MSLLLTKLMQLVGLQVINTIAIGVIRGISAALAAQPLVSHTKELFYWLFRKFIFGV